MRLGRFGLCIALFGLASCRGGALPNRGEFICFEAEAASKVEEPMRLEDDKGASGGQCLHIPDRAGRPPRVLGKAVYRFSVTEPGAYCLWARTWWADAVSTRMSVTVDAELKPDLSGSYVLTDATCKRWHWTPLRRNGKLIKFRLEKGEHTLEIGNRVDGTKLDQVLLTTDAEYVPVAIEKTTGHLVRGK